VKPSLQLWTMIFQTTPPVIWSRATSVPSSWATKTFPSPIATPRLSHPQQAVLIVWSIPE